MKDFKTLKEWNKEGRRIVKGQQSKVHDDDGTPVFHISQTWVPTKYSRNSRNLGDDHDTYHSNGGDSDSYWGVMADIHQQDHGY